MIARLRNYLTPQVVAFVLLACFTTFAFGQERRHSNQNRVAVAAATRDTARNLATTTYNVLMQGCYGGNDLRRQLNERNNTFHRVVINTDKLFNFVANTPGVHGHFKRALLGAAAENERIAASVEEIPTRDCAQAYAALRPAGVPIPTPNGN